MIESAEEFVKLRTSEIEEEYSRAANEEASIKVWRDIIHKYPDMKEWVVHNKTVPSEILELLSNDEDENVRFSVAMKRKLPEEIQLKLASDTSSSVRERLVYNKKTTNKVLVVLSNDSNINIKNEALIRLKDGK